MLRLIDPTHPGEGVQIDESALRELSSYIIWRAYGDWQTEDAYEAHSFHDDRDYLCAHCAIYRMFDGNGHAVACAQLAFTILSAGGPKAYMQQQRRLAVA